MTAHERLIAANRARAEAAERERVAAKAVEDAQRAHVEAMLAHSAAVDEVFAAREAIKVGAAFCADGTAL